MTKIKLSAKLFLIVMFSVLFTFLSFSFLNESNIKQAFLANVVNPTNLSDSSKKEEITTQESPIIFPAIIKSVYVTGWSAGSKNYINYLNNLFKTTQINAVVIDIKDSSGVISYNTKIDNIDSLLNNLHKQGIYVIGRISVFEDSVLAKNRPDLAIYNKAETKDLANPVLWSNNNGSFWMDPASEEVWDYNIEIARDALNRGFDEINFDYTRFPTDGQLDNMGFPKWDQKVLKNIVIKNFFKKIRTSLPDAKLSVDFFGLTTISRGDIGIGQILEDSFDYFDYVCPMLYPSHFASGFMGFENPAEHPYEVIKRSMESAILRRKNYVSLDGGKLAKIRPWIQDFNMGAIYDANMIKEEIRGIFEPMGSDFVGYMLWSPTNIYTRLDPE